MQREGSGCSAKFVESGESGNVIESLGGGRDLIANDVRDLSPARNLGAFGLIYDHTLSLNFLFYVSLRGLGVECLIMWDNLPRS
jgi:hypothetical protein